MAHLRPCSDCPHRKGCERKQEILDIIRPAKLSLANFKCEKRLSELQPGQRVSLEMMEMCERFDCDGDGYEFKTTYPAEMGFEGTVMRPHKNRILIWLDTESPLGKNPVALHPDRVFPIEGQRVNICPECHQPEETMGREWWCSEPDCLNYRPIALTIGLLPYD